MMTALDYVKANQKRFFEQWKDLVSIPTVGTDPAYAADVQRTAEWIVDDMRRIGLHNVAVMPTAGNPVVYGEWLEAGSGAPTVLIYAHYDVQPAVREDGWDSDPFTPTERNAKLYARGVSDDKAHVMVTLKAAEALLASTEGCPVNLKYLIEGEEESGSPNLPPFVRENRDRLKADFCLIADGGFETADQPVITYGMRGIAVMEVNITGPKTDLHSGMTGGTVHNPAQVIAEMVAKLHHDDGTVAVPGFYDDVRTVSDEERAELNKDDEGQARWDKIVAAPQPWGEPGYTLVERVSIRPTLEINGIYGGYTGDGFKTVIPAHAAAKISCRLVPDQDAEKIFQQVRDYIVQIAPPTVRVEVRKMATADPVLVETDNPLVQALIRAFRHHWQKPAQYTRTGGSIPIVIEFSKTLGLPCVPLGFGLADAGIHGPNEFYLIDMFYKGIDTIIYMLQEIAK